MGPLPARLLTEDSSPQIPWARPRDGADLPAASFSQCVSAGEVSVAAWSQLETMWKDPPTGTLYRSLGPLPLLV